MNRILFSEKSINVRVEISDGSYFGKSAVCHVVSLPAWHGGDHVGRASLNIKLGRLMCVYRQQIVDVAKSLVVFLEEDI